MHQFIHLYFIGLRAKDSQKVPNSAENGANIKYMLILSHCHTNSQDCYSITARIPEC